MRIAFVSFECFPDTALGGIGIYIDQAATAMASRGHDVEVFASSPKRNQSESHGGYRIHWIMVESRWRFARMVYVKLAERHKEQPFDVVEAPEFYADARYIKDAISDLPLVVKLHTPSRLVCELNAGRQRERRRDRWASQLRIWGGSLRRGRLPRWSERLRGVDEIDRVERRQAQVSDLVVAPCSAIRTYACDRWGIPLARSVVCPNVFSAPEALLRASADSDTRTIGYVGRLEARKGIDELITAAGTVLERRTDARLVLIGRSSAHPANGRPYDAIVREQLGKFGDRLVLRGGLPKDEVYRAIGECDICAFPSRWENFPNVCLEAMTAARGVIGSNAGGMAEMIEDKVSGLLVPPRDAAALADAMLELLSNPPRRKAMGLAARQRVLTQYGPQSVGAAMEDYFARAIAECRSKSTP